MAWIWNGLQRAVRRNMSKCQNVYIQLVFLLFSKLTRNQFHHRDSQSPKITFITNFTVWRHTLQTLNTCEYMCTVNTCTQWIHVLAQWIHVLASVCLRLLLEHPKKTDQTNVSVQADVDLFFWGEGANTTIITFSWNMSQLSSNVLSWLYQNFP